MPCLLARRGDGRRGAFGKCLCRERSSAESTQRCFMQLWHIPSSARACPKGPASRCLFMAHASQVQTTASCGPARVLPVGCTHGQEPMPAPVNRSTRCFARHVEQGRGATRDGSWPPGRQSRRPPPGWCAAADNPLCLPVPPLQLAQSHVFSDDALGHALRCLAERSSCHGMVFHGLQACF